MMAKDYTTSEWDQRQLFSMRLHKLLEMADYYSISDDYDNWYDCLVGVDRMVDNFCTSGERDSVSLLLGGARKWAKVTKRRVSSTQAQDKLNAAHKMLYGLCHKYGLLLPRSNVAGSGFSEL